MNKELKQKESSYICNKPWIFLCSAKSETYIITKWYFFLSENGEVLEFISLFNSCYESLANIFSEDC